MRSLILGGARSGKSRLAEKLLLASPGAEPCHYIATADARQHDEEMAQRVARHRADRGEHWITVESPLALAQRLEPLNKPGARVLVDCLTLWLANALQADCWPAEKAALLELVAHFQGELVMVSNEVGMGIVPMGPINRAFVDQSGWLHQALAVHCDRVVFVAAGLPLVLKGAPLAT